mmetsp:Transcript_26623/g.25490  ORF Transcript_26623/g.25490 Transcript_26623/m.25490 type:complete len:102 (-) Transcript_26623:276-581(-)
MVLEIYIFFLGDVVNKGINTEHHDVVVRAIEFKTNDTEFNEVLIDYRGNPQCSKIIVKLYDYKPRSDFIVKIVGDLIEECPKKQIIILGQNRSILKIFMIL